MTARLCSTMIPITRTPIALVSAAATVVVCSKRYVNELLNAATSGEDLNSTFQRPQNPRKALGARPGTHRAVASLQFGCIGPTHQRAALAAEAISALASHDAQGWKLEKLNPVLPHMTLYSVHLRCLDKAALRAASLKPTEVADGAMIGNCTCWSEV